MANPAGSTQPFSRLLGSGRIVPVAMFSGGFLWMVHGYFRFIMPYGLDAEWREELGYSEIINTGVFLLYYLPGVLALLLTSWSLLSSLPRLSPPGNRVRTAAQVMAWLALGFGLVAAVGQLVLVVAPTIGGVSFGTLMLGLASLLAGLAAIRDGEARASAPKFLARLLIATGLMGIATLPVQPMIFALALLQPGFGTAFLALFGAGWIVLSIRVRRISVQHR
jgi:hypothetical protein